MVIYPSFALTMTDRSWFGTLSTSIRTLINLALPMHIKDSMMNGMATWILAQNDEHHDVSTSSELALLAGMSFAHVLAAAAGRTVVHTDDAPVSGVAATARPMARAA